MIWYFLQLTFFVFYATLVLRYSNQFTGPFVSSTKFVFNQDTNISRPVNALDYIRRFTFNPYSINQKELWIEDEKKLSGWDCPICLSFWLSILSSIGFFLVSDVFVNPIAVAGLVSLIFMALEKDYGVQLQVKEENSDS